MKSHRNRHTCFLDSFIKSSASAYCLAFASFSLVLLVKMLLMKKACNLLIICFEVIKIPEQFN